MRLRLNLKERELNIIRILSIAGSDSSAGAGIQADIKTVHALGGYCSTAITSITSQNSKNIFKIYNLPKELIFSQIKAIKGDIGFDSIKIGLIPNIEVAKALSKFLKNIKVPVVIDPIFKATVGRKFISKTEYKNSQKEFFKIDSIITPNILEMEILSGVKINNHIDMLNAISKFSKITNQTIFLKGGDLNSRECLDLLLYKKKVYKFSSIRQNKRNTHGTGCTFSSAISFFLAKGLSIEKSIIRTKKYIIKSINNAPNFNLEYGPLGH